MRIEEIIREVCPEVEGYDTTADTEFHALRTAQADMQRRQQEMSRPRQAKLRTKKDVYVSQFVRMRVCVREPALIVCGMCVCVCVCVFPLGDSPFRWPACTR